MLEDELKKLTAAVEFLTTTLVSIAQAEVPEVEVQVEAPKVETKTKPKAKQKSETESPNVGQEKAVEPASEGINYREVITAECLTLSRSGKKTEIRDIFTRYNAKKVSDLADDQLAQVLAELKQLGSTK